ncbi:hypothetical protein C7N43_19550 [Sphingobacteriales bacterium UPWRP_1]|nr:hypothetical protein B6N25_02045 [Sphingobacteriales bacterium TSM_CSS]PSJ75338.1 hypothetical protein C7N43_19550 [Sphingobacteriales bacterium UPWRP_1]
MQDFVNIKGIMLSSLQAFGQSFMQAMPGILGALFLLISGWFIARLASLLFRKLLNLIKFDAIANRINANEMLGKANISLTPARIVSKFVYWIILLLFFVTATDTLGWTVVSEQISKLIGFLPTLLSGIVLFILGIYIATFFRDVLAAATSSLGVGGGKIISGFVFYFLMVIVTITALDQIGIDTTIITSNVVLILGAVLLSASISYGFASKQILANLLASFFSRKTFKVGQHIKIDDVEGEILQIDSITLTVQTPTDKVVMPTQELITRRVHITKESE